jgi:hypothetical protein
VGNCGPDVIDRDKVLSSTSVLTSADFDHEKATNFLDSLDRGLPAPSSATKAATPSSVT